VRAEEHRLLLAACQQTARDRPRLQHAQGESAEESAKSIDNEIDSFLGAIFRDRQETHAKAIETMRPLLMVYDLALLQICDLAHFAWENRESRVKLIWPSSPLPRRPRPSDIFYILVSNLAQLLQSVRLLLLNGFESQGRAAFRSFVELADLTVAALADEAFYRNYITVHEDADQEYRHWRRHLSPSVMRKRLTALDAELGIGSVTAIPASEVRQDTYRWFSLFSHVNMVAQMVSAYPLRVGEEGGSPLAMLGEAGEISRATFARALL
jgi:hypothetical protein